MTWKKNVTKKINIMKTIRFLAITLFCATLPMASSAQENLKKAIADFTTNKELSSFIKTSYSTETSQKNGVSKQAYYKSYNFELPKGKLKELKKLTAAFDMDADVAYKVLARDADIDDRRLTSVAYGEELDKSIAFGSYRDRNYRLMFVRDPQDSLRRYCYAIWWTEKSKDEKLHGNITEIYSPDPQMQETETDNVAEAVRKALKIPDATDSKVYFSGKGLNGEIKNSSDFFKRFSALRSAFLNPKVSEIGGVKPALASKLVDMCREHGKLLIKEERVTCIKGIKTMYASANDPYDRELLKLAISSLDY